MLDGVNKNKKGARRKRHSTKGVKTRARILDRAAQLFSKHSYADLGLQSLAAACGLSKAALFTHFKSKRQLYVQCVGQVFKNLLDAYVPSAAAKTARAKLCHYLDWLCPVMSENRLMCRLTLRMVLDHDVELARDLLPGSFGRTHDYLVSLLTDLHPKKDVRVMVFFLYAILTLNEELVEFAEIWTPTTASMVGGKKTAAYLERMILAW